MGVGGLMGVCGYGWVSVCMSIVNMSTLVYVMYYFMYCNPIPVCLPPPMVARQLSGAQGYCLYTQYHSVSSMLLSWVCLSLTTNTANMFVEACVARKTHGSSFC